MNRRMFAFIFLLGFGGIIDAQIYNCMCIGYYACNTNFTVKANERYTIQANHTYDCSRERPNCRYPLDVCCDSPGIPRQPCNVVIPTVSPTKVVRVTPPLNFVRPRMTTASTESPNKLQCVCVNYYACDVRNNLNTSETYTMRETLTYDANSQERPICNEVLDVCCNLPRTINPGTTARPRPIPSTTQRSIIPVTTKGPMTDPIIFTEPTKLIGSDGLTTGITRPGNPFLSGVSLPIIGIHPTRAPNPFLPLTERQAASTSRPAMTNIFLRDLLKCRSSKFCIKDNINIPIIRFVGVAPTEPPPLIPMFDTNTDRSVDFVVLSQPETEIESSNSLIGGSFRLSLG